MKTVIRFEDREYVELDNSNVELTNVNCKCGNKLINIPLAVIVLGIVDSCSHCGKDYPLFNHCSTLRDSYLSLVEGEELVEL